MGDARLAIRLGADAIGLNFYQKSLRSILVDPAAKLVEQLSTDATKVGVFVNHPADEIKRIVRQVRLDAIQLHGDETPEFVSSLDSAGPVIRAIRVPSVESQENLSGEFLDSLCDSVQSELNRWVVAGVSGILLDAARAGSYGGTGSIFPWQVVPRLESSVPIVLAGGLTPQTVGNAILTAKPDSVDVASGVEQSPGDKDEGKMDAFIREATIGFREIGRSD